MKFPFTDIVTVSGMKTRSKPVETKPVLTVINKTRSSESESEPKLQKTLTTLKMLEKVGTTEMTLPVIEARKSLNQSLASKSSGSKYIDEVEDYMEITNITSFEDIQFDTSQMTAIIDKEENITFTQDSSSQGSRDKFEIITATVKENITLMEGSNSCTFKIEYPSDSSITNQSEEGMPMGSRNFACRHCGKKYRWKSTLRRHENVECGGKAPAYECPYCDYKAKQRGNLGVHVRKHHAEMPQLETRRKRHSL